MKIIEQYSISKRGNQDDCEDIIFMNSSYAAIIDGATARSERLYDGMKPGLAAAKIIENSIKKLKESATLRDTLDFITSEFLDYYNKYAIKIEQHDQLLTASAVIFSRFYNQIWMIGDCQCLVNGITYNNPNGIDNFVSEVRSFINQAEILKGKSIEWIMENDPGSVYIKKLLVDQFLFQNLNSSCKCSYNYTAIDGRTINEKSVKVIQLDHKVKELILASDGYPIVCQTLHESENMLESMLKNDPLCIYEHKCVKGLKKGLISFDDRSYLKFSI